MSKRLSLPHCQQRYSNVAVVRVAKRGKRLEIACYKNKVVAYRSGLECSLAEVLQIERVFVNLSRGEYAGVDDIKYVLGDDFDEPKAVRYILDHGELQVGAHERSEETDEMLKEICMIIAEKCVHKHTRRPLPLPFIESTARSQGLSVRLDQPAKKQALYFMKQLIQNQPIPIERAPMRLHCATARPAEFLAECAKRGISVVSEPSADGIFILIEPEKFRELDACGKDFCSSVQVIETAVMNTSEGDAEDVTATCDFVPDAAGTSPLPPPAAQPAVLSAPSLPLVAHPPAGSGSDKPATTTESEKKAARRAQRKKKAPAAPKERIPTPEPEEDVVSMRKSKHKRPSEAPVQQQSAENSDQYGEEEEP